MDAARRAFDLRVLQTGNAALVEVIRARIRESGPVSFAWFMEQALYHPELGYYSSGRTAIGRHGDYFTNVSVGPVFGWLMAAQFAEMWAALGRPAEFTIVEQGAHDGQFAHDLLTSAKDLGSAFSAALRYQIVEPFAALRARQAETLASFGERVRWSVSLEALEPFCGVHFSNELLDSMPVHVVRWNGSEWLERCVGESGGEFSFVARTITSPELLDTTRRLPHPHADDYITEIRLASRSWVDALAQRLTQGFVVAVDYGFAPGDFYAPHRTAGTLQCYAAHRVLPSPLEHVGEADLTAHVEWSSIAEDAELNGLPLLGFTDQHHFITGLLAHTRGAALVENGDRKTQRGLQTLLHPGFLGMKFQFLVLGKHVDSSIRLSGLQFARDWRGALDLDHRRRR